MNWSQRLHEPFVYAALFIALTAGFGFGAGLVIARALGVPLGGWYPALVQAHGHAQLFGWVGLFIMGVGLTFLPKLLGAKLQNVGRVPLAFSLLVAGIALRSLVQPLAGFVGTNLVLRVLFLLSAVLELAGMLLVARMLVETGRAAKPLVPGAPAYAVELFAQSALVFLVLAFIFNLFGVWNVVSQSKNVLPARYDQLVITLVVYGVAIPMSFVFAIRTLPLFLRLVVPTQALWRTLALVYFVALPLRVLPHLLAIADDVLFVTGHLLQANYVYQLLAGAMATFGILLLNVCLLLGLARLNLLRRRGERSDHGEYGRFDLLIYSAYGWFVVATLFDIVSALPFINERILIPQDAARHALLLGFITLLIFGMAVRMLPGFSGKRRLAYPGLVFWLFVLGNAAAVLRVVPLFFGEVEWAAGLLALSGMVGWSAVLLLAFILWGTFRRQE
jgi:uncharacterized protein involved in response to NO